MTRIATINLIVTEELKGNIHNWNAYWDFDKYGKTVRKESFTKIFTNPQFGGKVTNNDFLNNFELGKGRKSQNSEVLKLEKSIKFLDSERDSWLCIVLPNGFLSNKGSNYVRDFIRRETIIKAVISLPQDAFQPYGSDAKTSLLFLKKKQEHEDQDLVFMADIKSVGYDNTGRDKGKNYLKKIPPLFHEFLENKKPIEKIEDKYKVFTVSPEKLIDRLDVRFYDPEFKEKLSETKLANRENTEIKKLKDIAKVETGHTPSREEYLEEPGIPIIKVGDLTNEGINWGRNKRERGYVPITVFKSYPKSHVEEEDIILTASAHSPKYLAKKVDIVNHIPHSESIAMIAGELIRIRLKKEYKSQINPYYLLSFLRSEYAYKNFQRCNRGQTGHIYPADVLEAITVPIPEKDYQDRLGRKIKKSLEHRMKMRKFKKEVTDEMEKMTKIKNFKENNQKKSRSNQTTLR